MRPAELRQQVQRAIVVRCGGHLSCVREAYGYEACTHARQACICVQARPISTPFGMERACAHQAVDAMVPFRWATDSIVSKGYRPSSRTVPRFTISV